MSRPTGRAPRPASHAETYAVPHASSTVARPARSGGRTCNSDSGTPKTPHPGSSLDQFRRPGSAYWAAHQFHSPRLTLACSRGARRSARVLGWSAGTASILTEHEAPLGDAGPAVG